MWQVERVVLFCFPFAFLPHVVPKQTILYVTSKHWLEKFPSFFFLLLVVEWTKIQNHSTEEIELHERKRKKERNKKNLYEMMNGDVMRFHSILLVPHLLLLLLFVVVVLFHLHHGDGHQGEPRTLPQTWVSRRALGPSAAWPAMVCRHRWEHSCPWSVHSWRARPDPRRPSLRLPFFPCCWGSPWT